MNQTDQAIDNFWENEIYASGNHLNRYPYDSVVSFIFRNYPRHKKRKDVKILEVGSGAGNNIWFAAREGFDVTGIEGSKTATAFINERLSKDGLKGQCITGNFVNLPFETDTFDIAIDRASITCCSFDNALKSINEVNRTLLKGGRFFFNPYSDSHSSFVAGKTNSDGTIGSIKDGTLKGIEHIYFFSKKEIFALFDLAKWKILSMEHCQTDSVLSSNYSTHAEWRVVAEKIAVQ